MVHKKTLTGMPLRVSRMGCTSLAFLVSLAQMLKRAFQLLIRESHSNQTGIPPEAAGVSDRKPF